MAKNTSSDENPPQPKERKPKPPNNARPISTDEAERYESRQTFNRYAENRSKKSPRKWVITYRLVDGPTVDPNKPKPSKKGHRAEEATEESARSTPPQPSFFASEPALPRRGGRRKNG